MSGTLVLNTYEQLQSQVGTANMLQVSRQYVHKVLKLNGVLTPTGRTRKTSEEVELEAKHFCQNSDCQKNRLKQKTKGQDMVRLDDWWFCSEECKMERFG